MKKKGVTIIMTTTTAKTLNIIDINIANVLGKLSSKVLTSFENLLRILPTGVVSKKEIGERRTGENFYESRSVQ